MPLNINNQSLTDTILTKVSLELSETIDNLILTAIYEYGQAQQYLIDKQDVSEALLNYQGRECINQYDYSDSNTIMTYRQICRKCGYEQATPIESIVSAPSAVPNPNIYMLPEHFKFCPKCGMRSSVKERRNKS